MGVPARGDMTRPPGSCGRQLFPRCPVSGAPAETSATRIARGPPEVARPRRQCPRLPTDPDRSPGERTSCTLPYRTRHRRWRSRPQRRTAPWLVAKPGPQSGVPCRSGCQPLRRQSRRAVRKSCRRETLPNLITVRKANPTPPVRGRARTQVGGDTTRFGREASPAPAEVAFDSCCPGTALVEPARSTADVAADFTAVPPTRRPRRR